ncbi:lipid-A-disaccharide synthase [Acidihalobacter ferrooxydans]|uniref:Lipid-A-disaccharide synthase n=1 Tax=Acidihalobacter ferrooxydans TaxID=1765967 RepID=A0A1P8UHA7_9GAMM|nr:lipid-A-disaccharide synthase [Acidihalobacter ferrooxydans]APZ43228.1 lipid-A-disaccharide synthase [Acidihalobacter ferrooxydans]
MSSHPDNPSHGQRILIVAGEASGDHHGARLVREVLRRAPGIRFSGIGGEAMRHAGVEVLIDSSDLAVVGLVEVLMHYRTLRNALELMREKLRRERPDLLVLIDYPDFNLRLAKTARELGIRVLYYISPQVWAWRQKRVHAIRECVDMMAVVFPFEKPFYEAADVPVRFVGHPLTDEVHSELSRAQSAAEFGLDPERPVVGLFPGSRRSELQRLLPLQLAAARLLREKIPGLQFILPRASTLSDTAVSSHLRAANLDVKQVTGNFYDIIQCCDAIVSASGTATLEIALMGKPLVVVYRVNPISYQLMRRLIKVDHIALCNIVAGRRVARELIQNQATPAAIATELQQILTDAGYADSLREGFAQIREKLRGDGTNATDIANVLLDMIAPSPTP